MNVILAKNWWSLLIRGLLALALGLIALVAQGITMSELALAFFGYAMIDGLVGLAGALRAAEAHQRWTSLLLEAAASITAAIVAVALPLEPYFGLLYVIAAWALTTGVFEIFSAVRLRKDIPGEWLMALSGAASLFLGVLMVSLPLESASTIALWAGVYGLAFGALLIGLALSLRSWALSQALSTPRP